MFQRKPQGFISLLILECMEDEPTYGYEILQKAKEISGGHWDPSYGTIYGALNRLEDNGVINPIEIEEHQDRQYYELTDKGREKLKEGREWRDSEKPESMDAILGFIHAYRHLHGEEELTPLLREIEEEFDFALHCPPSSKPED